MTLRWKVALGAAGLALALGGCGGGGGGGGSPAQADLTAQPQAAAAARAVLRVPAQAADEKAQKAGAGTVHAVSPHAAEGGSSPRAQGARDLYIVQMADEPVAAYGGTIDGYRATKPAKGSKIDPAAPDVSKYVGYLNGKHDAALASAGGGRKAYSYAYVFNGFAAALTEAQAAKLAATPGVLSVMKNEMRTLDTSSTPTFLGLDAPGGLWSQLGGAVLANGPNSAGAGEGIVIGIVDSGVWPEHPSFSDRDANGKLVYQQIPGWHGKCQPGEAFNASHCNQKLIGARYYNEGFGGNAGVDAELPFEFNSPRDHNGHGSHTASTAGGNHKVQATGDVAVLGAISGIAPRARIAAYKACWSVPGTAGSCFTVDTLAAIDQAVADGVDVINYSISGSRTNFRDPVEIAFLFAADAGVFVAASAGNSGPTPATVAHPGPWITTVAAGTHPRSGVGSLTLGNGATYSGASFVNAPLTAPLADAAALAKAGAAVADAERCFPGTLDSAKAAGKIVACKRGGNALVEKTGEVAAAGGKGAIVYNDPAGATNTLAIFHAVPTVHVDAAAGAAIKAYIAGTASPSARLNVAQVVQNLPAPLTASFSSRGPLLAGGGDLLKPDLIAPGQDILAAVAPPNNAGRLFDLYSGTSMSSPHVAGLAALLKQRRPDWSPMAIKSALMTSAGDVLDGPNTNPLVIFRQGAGHVRPNSAADPGLVYDSGFADWLGFLCGTQLPAANCTAVGVPVLDPSDLNLASIAVGDLAGSQTVTRRVTNVSGKRLTMTASTTGLAGLAVEVTPSTLTLAPGATASFTVKFTTTTGTLGAYQGGQLSWTGGGYTVRSPVVVRPVALAAPAQVSGSYGVRFGFNGPFTATPRGLIPAATSSVTLTQDPDQVFDPAVADGTTAVQVVVAAGTSYARFATFDADVAAGTDLDMYVYGPAGNLVGASAGGTSAEEVNLMDPAAGTYTVYLHGWGVPAGTSPVVLNSWLLGTAAAGNMTVVAPANAVVAGSGRIELSFSGLVSGLRYLGSVVYGGAASMPNPTIVRVDAP